MTPGNLSLNFPVSFFTDTFLKCRFYIIPKNQFYNNVNLKFYF